MRNELAKALAALPRQIGRRLIVADDDPIDDRARAIIRIIGEETEAQRARQRGTDADFIATPMRLLSDEYSHHVDGLDWSVFLQDIDVLSRCVKRAQCSASEILELAMRRAGPDYWRALFWMKAYLEPRPESASQRLMTAQEVTEMVAAAKHEERRRMIEGAASKRHQGNRTDKLKVFAWCDENMDRFSSMDEAALDIAEAFVPQKFRAVRAWMTEWKRQRSTGRT